MKVLIRTDASTSIGIGHLVRCAALAEALVDGGDEVVLLTARTSPTDAVAWRGQRVEILDAAAGSPDDVARTLSLVRSVNAAWVVLDGYRFPPTYRDQLAGSTRLLLFDDHGARDLDASLVVNGNLYADRAMYPGARARCLLGPRHAALRRAFASPPTDPPARADRVLVSLGGADPDARTPAILAAMARRDVGGGDVVIGPLNPVPDEVRDVARRLGWMVHEAPQNLAALIRRCSVAVIGAGSGTLEALALGAPIVAVRIADNQDRVVDSIRMQGLGMTADGSSPEAVADATARLLADPDLRARLSRLGRETVDGRGASRIAAAMRADLIVLRQVAMTDADLLLAWRIDPATRDASFGSPPIDRGSHVAWLARSLGDPKQLLRIAEAGGRPIGTVRLDLTADHRATISVTVAPEARGRGWATNLIRAALGLAAERDIEWVDAEIKPDNAASIGAFRAAGFVARDVAERRDRIRMTARPRQRG